MALIYNPNSAKIWADQLIELLNGSSGSIASCSKKFRDQLNSLVVDGVWTGPAAKANYDQFVKTDNAMIKFINGFGREFAKTADNLRDSIKLLESTAQGNVRGFNLSNVNYTNVLNGEMVKIEQSYVTYNYAKIISIKNQLDSIKNNLSSVNDNIQKKINEIGKNSTIWGGDAAEGARNNLSTCLKNNMNDILANLEICIKNIKQAAENANRADTAK